MTHNRFIVLSIWLSLIAGTALAVDLAAETDKRYEILQEGNAFFREGNRLQSESPKQAREAFVKALRRYEQLCAQGIRHGRLNYNLGCTHFRLGNLGEAIRYFRLADRSIPNDPDIQQSLRYARSRRIDIIQPRTTQELAEILFFWHYDLHPRTSALLLLVLHWLFWSSLLLRYWRPRWIPVKPLVLLSLIWLAFLGSVMITTFTNKYYPEAIITAPEVVARKGDSKGYQPAFQAPLHAGTEIRVLQQRKGWMQCELIDGRTCWLPEKAVTLLFAPS